MSILPRRQDTPIRALDYYDADIQDYPRIPSYLIFDEEGRALGPVARPIGGDERARTEWSDDNLAEVKKGFILTGDSLKELASKLSMDAEDLTETVQRWNASCRAGRDRDLRRPPGTMMALEHPPFYAITTWPVITNTQGGLVHNQHQQVLASDGQPIPRLYKAGEMGSVFGHLYMLAGNNSECFIGGRVAGEQAASVKPWT